MYRKIMGSLLLVTMVAWGTEIALTGTIKDEEGKAIENALIRFENAGYVTVSNSSGGFVLSEQSPVKQSNQIQEVQNIRFINNKLHFSVSGTEQITFTVHTLQGKRCVKRELSGVAAGRYQVSLAALIPSTITSGTYVATAKIGKKVLSVKILHNQGVHAHFRIFTDYNELEASGLARKFAVVDAVTISKLGYISQTIQIENYKADIGEIVLKKSTALSTTSGIASTEDSLFTLFIKSISSMDTLDGPDELNTIDFISIRNGFEAILAIDSQRVKSNVGYMLSALASLNVNSEIWKIADSLDAYFSAIDNKSEEQALMKKAMAKGGVLALGKAMAVKTPQIVMGSTQNPSFPKFLTISYLQDVIERHLLPVLDNVQRAAERVELLADGSMKLTVDGDTYEVDKGEIYLFDASVNLLRAYGYMMCVYDMDLYTSAAKKDYSWIDTLVNNESTSKKVYTLSGDTLYEINSWNGDIKMAQTAVSMLHYNLEERSEFMTIRKPFHTVAHNSLKAVPAKIKSGLAAIRAETDDQSDDLLKISMIDTANADMLDMSGEMRDEGISPAFAEHFSSIDKLMDFVNEMLSGPVVFNETIDGKQINLTIDISALFSNPVNDMRTLLPKYSWTNSADWFAMKSESWENGVNFQTTYNAQTDSYDTTTSFFVNHYDSDEEVIIAIDTSLYTITNENVNYTMYSIKKPLKAYITIDSSFYFDALRLKDGEGNVMSEETMQTLIDNNTFFPYFNDYTFHGLFPEMNRQKWLDLVWSE